MKYRLNEQQYKNLWKKEYNQRYDNTAFMWDYNSRLITFKERFGDKLIYSDSTDAATELYWGMIEGDDKDINWFLLNL